MTRTNLIITATIIATFVISMCVLQQTTEASINATPKATPSPRRKAPKPIQSPKSIRSPITKDKAKKPAYKEGGVNDTTFRTRKSKTNSNRRKFDHIGNIKTDSTIIRQKTSKKEFSTTMMEGSNIRRKQPRRRQRKN